MPGTVEALLVLFIAVLPGALHTWALEREAGRWGAGFSDRILRFVGTTAIYQTAFAYPVAHVWTNYLHRQVESPSGGISFINVVERGSAPWWLWLLPAAYAAVPIAGGTIAGLSVNRWPNLSRILVGRDPAPRAWDFFLFSARPRGVIRARLKASERWIGGWFDENSYAAGYPEQPQDLLIERTYRMLEDGTFAEGLASGGYDEIGSSLLIRWDEITELEFFPADRSA